jgi:hypothetical protein
MNAVPGIRGIVFMLTIPALMLCAVAAPPAQASPIPAASLAGQWEYVGWASDSAVVPMGEAVDIVRLSLVDFPPGTIQGSWTETWAPGYQSVSGMGGCTVCGPPGTRWASSPLYVGRVTRSYFEFTVGTVPGTTFAGAVEKNTPTSYNHLPTGTTRYGCFPWDYWQQSELFIVSGANVYVFFRPSTYARDGVGPVTPGTNQDRSAPVPVAVGRHLSYCG